MNGVGMKNQIQLADVFEAFIERFHKNLNQIKNAKFRFATVNAENKVEGRIVTVDEFTVG